MHVHVDRFHRHVQEQRGERIAPARHEVLIGAAYGGEQQPVFHRPPVYEQILQRGIRAVERGAARETRYRKGIALQVHRLRIVGKLTPHDAGEPLPDGVFVVRIGAGQREGGALADGKRKPGSRTG